MAEFKMPKFVYKDKSISLDECYRELSKMSYQSPIEVIYQGFETKFEGDIYESILHYGVSVDKEELIKALKYDRDQYERGFIDGCKGEYDRIRAEVAREIFEEIGEYAEQQIEALSIAEKVDTSGIDFFGGGKQAFCLLLDRLAELKKKYTEG